MRALDIRVKRIYDPPAPDDGTRILVDRLWPRGVARAGAGVDEWLPSIAPSTELRRWFGHDPAKWPEFRARYEAELAGQDDVERLRTIARRARLTLLYSARDTEHNQAVALAAYLLSQAATRSVSS